MTLLARWGYTLLLVLLTPLLFASACIQRLRTSHPLGKRWLSRFGLGFEKTSESCVLIHCVSVGEVTAAAPLIRRMLVNDKSQEIVVTTTTATGAEQVRNLFGDQVRHYYLPIDLPPAMWRMLNRLRPQKILIVEVELWPNMLHLCASRSIPVILINGRMTERSANTYARVSSLFSPMLDNLTHVAAQGQRDADQYLKLGLEPEKLTLTHNLKFDLPVAPLAIDEELQHQVNPQHRPLLLAGSTHDPEESILLDALARIKARAPDTLLVIVPRHPQRFDIVYELCRSQGWQTQRSSKSGTQHDTDVLLIDEMGKLSALYQLADIAYVGGSLADRGGHNALEAARFGVPVMMGPSQHNNPEICRQLADAGALVTVQNASEIAAQSLRWLEDADKCHAAGAAGQHVIRRNSGALDATLELVDRY